MFIRMIYEEDFVVVYNFLSYQSTQTFNLILWDIVISRHIDRDKHYL